MTNKQPNTRPFDGNAEDYWKELAREAIIFGANCAMDGLIWDTDKWYSDYIKSHPIPTEVKELDRVELPTDEQIHFIGKEFYNCDIVSDGKDKQKIITMAAIWRRGAIWMRDHIRALHNTSQPEKEGE